MAKIGNKDFGVWEIDSVEGNDDNSFPINLVCDEEFIVLDKPQFKAFDILVHGPLLYDTLGIELDNLEILIILKVGFAKGNFSYTYDSNEISPAISLSENTVVNGIILIVDPSGQLIGGRKTKGQISHPDYK
jgi:hypothetical protein